MDQLITDNLEQIRALCRQHHVIRLFAFGSVTNAQFNAESDIDFLYEPDYSGFDPEVASSYPYDPLDNYFKFKESLRNLLGKKVDLVPYKPFKNPYFNKTVEATKRLLFQDERYKEVSR